MKAEPTTEASANDLLFGDPGTELASNRTALAFERTRIASDRTLMALIRTSLSLISFGFTIFTFVGRLAEDLGSPAVTLASARNFGLALVLLGVGLLIAGLFTHYEFLTNLRGRRSRLHDLKLLRTGPQYRTSLTTVLALLLLLVGLLAVLGMIARTGPFG